MDRVRRVFPTLQLTVLPDVLQGDTAPAAPDAELLSVFVKSRVDKATLEQFPKLRLIATRSTGYDHIDLAECERRNILVANVPTYGENTVAEHAFALILALSRKIFQSYERTERMSFDRTGLQGFDLFGKTLGVVGIGHIGKHSIRIGRGFSMRVIGFDVHQDAAAEAELGFSYVSTLEDLFEASDVVTLHAPYVPATHHLVNMETVKHMKRGAILINTSRGALVDTQALLYGLAEGILSGAGLDVLEEETGTYEEIELLSKGFPQDRDIAAILRNHLLVARENVIITPHNAFNSGEAVQRIFDTTAANIQGFLAGKPINVVLKRAEHP